MAETPPVQALEELNTSLTAQALEQDCMEVLLALSNYTWDIYVYLTEGDVHDEERTIVVLTNTRAISEFFQEFAFRAEFELMDRRSDVESLPTLHPQTADVVLRQALAVHEMVADWMLPLPIFEIGIFRLALRIWRNIIRPLYNSVRYTYLRSELSIPFLSIYMHLGQLERGLEGAIRACNEANRLYERVSRHINEARQWRVARQLGPPGLGRRPGTANSDVSDLELGEAVVRREDRVIEQRLLIEGGAGESESAIEDDVEGGGDEGSSNVIQVSPDRDVRVNPQASSTHGRQHSITNTSGQQHRQRSFHGPDTTSASSSNITPRRRRKSWRRNEAPKTRNGRELQALKEEEEEE